MGVSKNTACIYLQTKRGIAVVAVVAVFGVFSALNPTPVWADAECTVDAAAARPQLINGRYVFTEVSGPRAIYSGSGASDPESRVIGHEVRCRVVVSDRLETRNQHTLEVEVREFILRRPFAAGEGASPGVGQRTSPQIERSKARLRSVGRDLCSQRFINSDSGNTSSRFGALEPMFRSPNGGRQVLENRLHPQGAQAPYFSVGRNQHEHLYAQDFQIEAVRPAMGSDGPARARLRLRTFDGVPACSAHTARVASLEDSRLMNGYSELLRNACRHFARQACGDESTTRAASTSTVRSAHRRARPHHRGDHHAHPATQEVSPFGTPSDQARGSASVH